MSSVSGVSKTFLTTTAVSALLAAPALAADPAVYRAPPVFTWTGFYIGAHAGAALSDSSYRNSAGFGWRGPNSGNDPAGVLGGLQAGYNWQAGNLVLGVEADISAANASGNVAVLPAAPIAVYRSSLDWMGTLRLRGGFAFDRTLIYATGGLAYGGAKQSLFDAAFPFTASVGNRTGWAAGVGVEYALTNNWSTRIEYIYTQFNNRSVATNGYGFTFRNSVSVARAGLNYKF